MTCGIVLRARLAWRADEHNVRGTNVVEEGAGGGNGNERRAAAREGHKEKKVRREDRVRTHPLIATMQRAPLVGSLRWAKSRAGSHISVSVLGRYPPTDDVSVLVRCSERRRTDELGTARI
jgi:hypothetical protein